MVISTGKVTVDGSKIFYREAGGDLKHSDGVLLLLHGMRFSSANWEEVSTLQKLSEWNFRAVAVDLPGYENSKEAPEPVHKGIFLRELCSSLNIAKAIIVSPSMSGQYSLPFLHDHGKLIRAFIPVVPVSTEKYTIQQYEQVKVPTFIVYGENDHVPFLQTSIKALKNIPESSEIKMKDAGHACYLDQPDNWHTHLREILSALK